MTVALARLAEEMKGAQRADALNRIRRLVAARLGVTSDGGQDVKAAGTVL